MYGLFALSSNLFWRGLQSCPGLPGLQFPQPGLQPPLCLFLFVLYLLSALDLIHLASAVPGPVVAVCGLIIAILIWFPLSLDHLSPSQGQFFPYLTLQLSQSLRLPFQFPLSLFPVWPSKLSLSSAICVMHKRPAFSSLGFMFRLTIKIIKTAEEFYSPLWCNSRCHLGKLSYWGRSATIPSHFLVTNVA